MAVAEPYLAPVPLAGRLREQVRSTFAGTTTGSYVALGAVALLVLVTILTPLIAPHDPTLPVGQPLTGPSGGHLMGTDEIGRDILSRVLYGMRSSWWGALVVITSGALIGGFVGLVAGAAGGIVDGVFMRFTDIFLAMPGAVLAIAVVAALGPSYTNTLVAISIVWWPLYARIMRGEIRRLRASPHIEAARLAGAGRVRIALRHLLPGATPQMLVAASLDVSALVLMLAGLSFLGLGAPAPAPELGAMTARGVTYMFTAWWVPIMPATAVFALALVANLGGDALRDRMKDR